MKNEEFYTILTKIGKSKIANAIALNTPISLTKFYVGDGNGDYYQPTEEQTELKNKLWEGPINSVRIDENNPNWVILEVIIPGNEGGFTIREVGAYDDEGDLIAIGKFPQTYKPLPSDGSLKELILKMVFEVSNTNSVVLKVDPTVILATQEDINNLNNKIEKLENKVNAIQLVDTKVKLTDSENLFGFGKDANINQAILKNREDINKALQTGADVKKNVMSAINSKHTVLDVTIDDTWDTYIQRIIDIKEGRGDALTSHVLQGKTFTNHTGNLLTGTIPNRGGGQTITPGTGNKTLYSGYYSGNITILGDSDLVSGNILGGKNIFGVNGSIPNRGNGRTITPTTTDINLDYGYYATRNIIKGDANLKPENIKEGVNIFGTIGTLKPNFLDLLDLSHIGTITSTWNTVAVNLDVGKTIDKTNLLIIKNNGQFIKHSRNMHDDLDQTINALGTNIRILNYRSSQLNTLQLQVSASVSSSTNLKVYVWWTSFDY